MKVSHLVVNGCSWTFCEGLEKPHIQGWPALVAEEFNLPVVNLAVPGSGNDGIHRRTYEYAFEDRANNNHPFYIIAWTQPWRREAWCKKLYNPNIRHDGYNTISFPHKSPSNSLEYAVLDTWSDEDFYRKTRLYRLSLDSLFRSNNIEYLSSFFSDEEYNGIQYEDKIGITSIKARFASTTKYLLTNTNKLQDFFRIADPYPKTPCGHEGLEGNKAVADYIINEIKIKYNTIEPVNEKYLSLSNYYKKTDLNNTMSCWM